MNVREVQPEHRLDRTFFDIGSDTKNHEISIGHYICPQCDQPTRFTSSDLERRFHFKSTNLESEAAAAFDKANPVGSWTGFLDFHCQGCREPVRIIYEHAGEFAMGAFNYRVVTILEKGSSATA